MTPKNFLDQYLIAHSGTQVPARFLRWAALFLVEMTVGRKVYYSMQHFDFSPEWHNCFVGNQGSGKSTAKDQAEDMYIEAFPDRPLGPAISSREMIIKYLASDQPLRYYINEKGDEVAWRPVAYFPDEFTNFISFNPKGMIEFLTNIFGKRKFVSETLARGKESIDNPLLLILACTTPDNFAKYMKADIISGGFSRRMIPVFEMDVIQGEQRITDPEKSPEAYEAEKWCIEHLRKIDKIAGPFTYDSQETKDWFDQWNKTIHVVEDNVLSGYHFNKDILARKLAMCIACMEEEPKLLLTRPHLELAIHFLLDNEKSFQRLIAPIGRNELAGPQQKLLFMLEALGGAMPEKAFHRQALRDMTEAEYQMMKRSLRMTDQLFEHEGAIMLYSHMVQVMARLELEKRKQAEETKNAPVAPTP